MIADWMPRLRLAACCLAAGLAVGGATRAAAAEDFYRGKTIRVIISSTVGGGYDIYARTLARYLGQHIPGNPIIAPENMPSAGGISAANYVYNVVPKDPTVVLASQNTVPFEPFFDDKLALFDATKFNWLGTPTTEVALYMVYHTSKIQNLRDAQTIPMTAGAAGAASTPAFYGRLFNDIFHLKAKLITGYPGQNEIWNAMEQGEVDANPSPFWSSMKTSKPDWYPTGKARFLFQYGLHPHPELPNVPFGEDLLTSDTDKQLLATASAPLGLGRPYMMGPGVPAEQVAIIEKAFLETTRDPAFLTDCDKERIECADVHDGADMAALIKRVYAVPPEIRKRLVDIQMQGEGSGN